MWTSDKVLQGSDTAGSPPRGALCEVDRTRFTAELNNLSETGRTAICVWAAAGSGKSVLAAAWARSLVAAGQSVRWLRARELDEDPGLIAKALLARPESGEPLYVFVDDAHDFAMPETGALLHGLLDQPQAGLRLILSGRFQPFSSVMYLEATGAVTELRTADLAFTSEEIVELAALHEISLPGGSVNALMLRTGGWATALALVMTLLRDSDEPVAVIERFNGDDRAVADYLVGEVLSTLQPDERELLLAVAVAGRVPEQLVVELTGRHDAGAVIRRLAQRNALIAEDDDGVLFHPVLGTFLAAEARRNNLDSLREHHQIAARWYAERGNGAEALEQATATGVFDVIAEMMDRFGIDLVLAGRSSALLNALARLPRDREPMSAVVIRLLIEAPHYADASRARYLFAAAERAELASEGPIDSWDVALFALRCLQTGTEPVARGRLSRLRDADVVCVRAQQPGVDLLAEIAEAWGGDRFDALDEAIRRLRDVGASAHRAGYDLLYWIATELASTLSASAGRWEESSSLEDQMVAHAQSHRFSLHDRAGAGAVLVVAGRAFQRCKPMPLERLDRIVAADPIGADLGVVVPARALRLLPEVDGADNPRPALDELERLMGEWGARYPRLLAVSAVRSVAIRMTIDVRARALEMYEIVQRGLGTNALETLTARFLLDAQTRNDDGPERLLEKALTRKAQTWHSAAVVDAWLVLARAAQQRGRLVEADARVSTALDLGKRIGAVRPFLARGGDGMALVAARLGRLGHLDEFGREIMDRAHAILPDLDPLQGRVLQPLTERERAVLQELPVHQSVAEIAHRQSLSVNTIKTHLRNIYQKLGAGDRSEAVQIATRNGLL